MYWVLIGVIGFQFISLSCRGVGLFTLWIFIEYLQLVGYMAIYNFRLIPYLYDIFKPAHISHGIFFNDTPFIKDLDKEYFNKNYENYWLSVGRLSQAFAFIGIMLVLIVLANSIVLLIQKYACCNVALKAWADKTLIQFKFNHYLRFYMLIYFDTTFFSLQKLSDPRNENFNRKATLMFAYVILFINILVPVLFCLHILMRFSTLNMKASK